MLCVVVFVALVTDLLLCLTLIYELLRFRLFSYDLVAGLYV